MALPLSPCCGATPRDAPIVRIDAGGRVLVLTCSACHRYYSTPAAEAPTESNWRRATRAAGAVLYWLVLGLAALDGGAGVGLRAELVTGTALAVAAIISAIGSWFGRGARGTAAEVQRALRGIRDALAGVAGQLVNFVRDTGRLLALVARALGRFWREILRPLFVKLDDWIRRAFRWLRETFGPILEFLRDVRRRILELYTKWLRPIFDTIDAIRRVLGILGRFGVQWARELDAKLAELEDRLLEPIRFALRKLNEVIDVIDRVITLDGLLQRYVLAASLVRDAGLAWRALYNTRAGTITEEDRERIRTGGGAATAADVRREIAQYVATGGGPLAAYAEAGIRAARDHLGEISRRAVA